MTTDDAKQMTVGGEMWYEHRAERHQIVAIEYQHRRPFNVLTAEHWDHSAKPWFKPGKDRATGVAACHWDFEWCKQDGVCYFHMSGCGGNIGLSVSPFVKRSPPPGEIWTVPGFPLSRYGRGVDRPITKDSELLSMGYRRLRRPRLLTSFSGTKTRNPFDASDEGECVYCSICNDHLNDDSNHPCEHLEYCNGCSMWVYSDGRKLAEELDGVCDCTEDDR